MKMPYEDDTTWSSNMSYNISPSKSRGLVSPSILGKRQERVNLTNLSQLQKKGRNLLNTQEFAGNLPVKCLLLNTIIKTAFGAFKLQADAAKAYDRARLLIPCTLHKHQNFANEEEYQVAREKEIRMKYREEKSQMKLEYSVKEYTPKFPNEAQILSKFGLTPKSTPSEESPSLSISPKDSHNYQGFLTHDDTLSSDSSDDEADIRKTKKPRISRKTKLPNNCKKSIEDEVIDLASSDEEDNNESMFVSAVVPDEDKRSTSKRTESFKEDIVDSGVIENTEANTAHFALAENRHTIEENQARNKFSTVEVSPTKNGTPNENQDNAYLVLKKPLVQILQIHHMTYAMEKEIEEYCRALFYEKRCLNETYLETLEELSEEELEEMFGFMQPLQREMAKNWVKECREKSEGIWI